MVIQRWQTVFLFLAALVVVIFTLVPFANITTDEGLLQLRPAHFVGWMTLNVVIALLLFIAIFLYRNIKFQKKVTLISIVMIVVSAVTGGLCLYGPQVSFKEVDIIWGGGIVLLLLAALLAIWAYRRMTADQRLLSDSSRIR